MSKLPALALLLLFLVGCAGAPPADGGDTTPPIALDGLYRGRYWITHQDGTSDQNRQDGNAWMSFDKGSYEVQGDFELLPPAGGGEYYIDGRVLVLKDTVMHTANFDWTLILNGRFDVDMSEDGAVRLTQRDLEYARYHELELRPVIR